MRTNDTKYQKHVFVCVNEREDGSCCAKVCGEEIAADLKAWSIENKLRDRVRITKAKCLGCCNDVGATIVIYPEQKWLLETKKEDLDLVKKTILDSL